MLATGHGPGTRPGGAGHGGAQAVTHQPWEAPATLRAARALAGRHGAASAPAWAILAKDDPEPPVRGLALATLAVLADRPEGADALVALLLGGGPLVADTVALSLLADFHGGDTRPVLERLVTDAVAALRAKPSDDVRYRLSTTLSRAAAVLLAVGDRDTRAKIQALADRAAPPDPAAHALRFLREGLDARLALTEAELVSWSRDAVEFFKAAWLYSGNISARLGASQAAGLLAVRNVKLGVPFLRFMLGRDDDLAVASAGNQRESALVPELVQVARRKPGGYVFGMALEALGQIGTREALDALLGFVRPGVNPDSSRIAGPLDVLARPGDAATLKELRRMADDPAFSPADRADLAAARDFLADRLAGKRPAPAGMMGQGVSFPPR